jgi:hypothetical protein
VLKLGLDHQLVTSQTSLVAVDKTPSRPAGTPLARADLPLNLPAGWDFDVLFGGARHPGADGQADADADQQAAGLDLPQTATDGPMLVMIGLGLLALGGALGAGGWVLSWKRPVEEGRVSRIADRPGSRPSAAPIPGAGGPGPGRGAGALRPGPVDPGQGRPGPGAAGAGLRPVGRHRPAGRSPGPGPTPGRWPGSPSRGCAAA